MKDDKKVITFEELYRELRLYILSFLDPRELARIAPVSKEWEKDSKDNALWRAHLKKILGEENQNFSKDLYKKIHRGSFELLEIMKNKKLKQAIEQTQELQKQCKLEFIINHFEDEMRTELQKTHKPIPEHPLVAVYERKKNVLDEWQGDGATIDDVLKNNLGFSNYAKVRTLDFFVAHGWEAPEWFVKMHKKLQVDESSEEPPRKMQKSR